MKKYSKLDIRIIKHYERIMSRCYNPNDPSYPNYGGRGVYVCEAWKNNQDQFIMDFKQLPGYNEWLSVEHNMKYLYHLDKDLRGSYIDDNGVYHESLVYSPETCSIIHNQLNARIKHIENKRSKYRGVIRSYRGREQAPDGKNYGVKFSHDHITYSLGYYSSELAAASVYNYMCRHIPNMIPNELNGQELPIDEAMKYLRSRRLIVPSNIKLPNAILNCGANIIYDGSLYVGVKKSIDCNKNAYRAFGILNGQEVFIGVFDLELAAANSVNWYYMDHGLQPPNALKQDQQMSKYQIANHRIQTYNEKRQMHDNKVIEEVLYTKLAPGSEYIDYKGHRYEIIKILDDNLRTAAEIVRGFPVLIKSKETGALITVSSRTILNSDKAAAKDYLQPSICGVGYRGMPKLPSDSYSRNAYRMWGRMLRRQCAINESPEFIKNTIDERWYNFANFLHDLPDIYGYDEFKANYINIIYVIENITRQTDIKIKDRVWNLQTCTIMPYSQFLSISKLYAEKPNRNRGEIMQGITKNASGTFSASISFSNCNNHPNGRIYIGTFDQLEMAAAARDYYSRYFKHEQSNNGLSDSIPPSEWQKHKSRMQQLYHCIKRPLFTNTDENEDNRRERCKKLYGINI